MDKIIKELQDEIIELRRLDWENYSSTIQNDIGLECKEFIENGTEVESFDDIDSLVWSEGYQKGIQFAINKLKEGKNE